MRVRTIPLLLAAAALAMPLTAAETLTEKAPTEECCKEVWREIVEPAFGEFKGCFVIYKPGQDGMRMRYNDAMVREAVSPHSTFKMPNTLIALETGVVKSTEFKIKWDGKKRLFEDWNADQTLAKAYQNSTIWYYQEVARRVGAERMQQWVDALGYGNRDISGGIDQFWLGSTLKISADEQVDFLEKLQSGQLPVSKTTIGMAREVMRLDERDGVVLYGKTGADINLDNGESTMGWFVGWVERNREPKEPYFFATRITGGTAATGKEARRISEAIVIKMGYWNEPPAPAHEE